MNNPFRVIEVSPLWLATADVGTPAHGGLPPLGDQTCGSQHDDGYWCSLPFDHRGSKHIAQDEKTVVAVWHD